MNVNQSFIKQNIVSIICKNDNGVSVVGAGFLIEKGVVITCRHVIWDYSTSKYYSHIEVNRYTTTRIAIAFCNRDIDLAVLFIPELCNSNQPQPPDINKYLYPLNDLSEGIKIFSFSFRPNDIPSKWFLFSKISGLLNPPYQNSNKRLTCSINNEGRIIISGIPIWTDEKQPKLLGLCQGLTLKLTEQVFTYMEESLGVPDSILYELRQVNNQSYPTEKEFTTSLLNVMGEGFGVEYKSGIVNKILKYICQDIEQCCKPLDEIRVVPIKNILSYIQTQKKSLKNKDYLLKNHVDVSECPNKGIDNHFTISNNCITNREFSQIFVHPEDNRYAEVTWYEANQYAKFLDCELPSEDEWRWALKTKRYSSDIHQNNREWLRDVDPSIGPENLTYKAISQNFETNGNPMRDQFSFRIVAQSIVDDIPNHQETRCPSNEIIFICHAKEDEDIASQVFETLKSSGFNAFLDHKSLSGKEWDIEIKNKIEKSRHFIIILSKNLTRKYLEGGSYVVREITLAFVRRTYFRESQRFMIIYRVDDVNPHDIEELSHIQWVESIAQLIGIIKDEKIQF